MTSETNNEAAEGCAALIVGWLLGWGTGALRALVVMKGWEWFVSDTFGWPELSLIQTWGLVVLISLLTMQIDNKKNDYTPAKSMWMALIGSVLLSGFAFISLLILSTFL